MVLLGYHVKVKIGTFDLSTGKAKVGSAHGLVLTVSI